MATKNGITFSILFLVFIAASVPLEAASCSSTSLGNGLTCVISASAASTGASTGATTSAINTTGTNFLVVVATGHQGGNDPTISDSKSNTWTTLTGASAVSIATQETLHIYYSQNPTVGTSHTFTCSGTSTFCSITVAAISGMQTSGVFDSGKENGATVTAASTSLQTGSITPTSGVRLIVCGFSQDTGNNTLSIDSSMTIFESTAGAGGLDHAAALALKSQATGTAINPTWSLAIQADLAANIAAFDSGAHSSTCPWIICPG